MGEIDYVAVIESENDLDALGVVMAIGKSKYFSTTTLKAYPMEQMKRSIDIYESDFSVSLGDGGNPSPCRRSIGSCNVVA